MSYWQQYYRILRENDVTQPTAEGTYGGITRSTAPPRWTLTDGSSISFSSIPIDTTIHIPQSSYVYYFAPSPSQCAYIDNIGWEETIEEKRKHVPKYLWVDEDL